MSGVVIQFDAQPIRPPSGVVPVENVLFCPCDFRCDFEELVFASSEGDGIQNDFTDFLVKKITASDTILIQLIKNNVVIATINNDDYGTFYDGFTNQPLYVGWLADWTKIFDTFSGGLYNVRITTTILGEETIFTSRNFRLNTFDILSADKTVKIETRQNGRFENGEFDFTDLVDGGWLTSIRLNGQFGKMKPNLEADIYQDPSYRVIQNRDQVRRDYALTANIVPESIFERIATQDSLANEIFVTAYDVLQELKYEKYPVKVDSFSDPRYDDLGRTFFEITCSDRQPNIIKSNVR